MFPIKDTIRARIFPVVNWALIIINVLVFLFEISLSQGRLDALIDQFGLVPAHIQPLNPLTWYPYLTHMFLHGGWVHLISNVWMLLIFGDNIEERMGSGRFLIFYLLGGIAAGMVQNVLGGNPNLPAVGASGAIAAVMGAYILFFPTARVNTLVLLIFVPLFVQIPALIFLGLWFVSQLFSGLAAIGAETTASGGVAFWAHIGGFVFGVVAGRLFSLGRTQPRWYPDEFYPY